MKTRIRVRRAPQVALAAVVAAVAIPTAVTAAIPTAAPAATKGKVTVVHAVPDATVDVYANDTLLLEDFEPGTITGPVRLDPGDYDIKVTAANTSDVILSATAPVTAETDAAAVAYLDETGDPTVGLLGNNQRSIGASKARVTVRHTAAAPEVDIRFKRPRGEWRNVTTDLMNGEQASRGLKARRYRFDVVLAGTQDRVLGPVALKLERLTHYYVYAWGSATDENLALNVSTRRLSTAH